DLRVKHATPLGPRPLEEEAHDLAARGGADALALTGPRTGTAVDPEELQRVRAAVPRLPLLAASGVTANSVASVLRLADGVLVGTALKRGGRTDAPVDPRRAASFVRAARS
ncbi:MAG: BtpA/SgcQ family protein, partial [Planctomycetota bacterium]